jgi:DHA3 family macrolide efflux protein-like MFS transporter
VVVGGLILGVWGGFRRRIFTSMVGLTGIGLGFLLVGLAPSTAFVLAVGAMFLAGVMNPITNGPLFSIIQSSVDPGMQGRVFALVQSMATAATPLGMLIAGPVADALGVRVWYVVGGLGCLSMGIGGFFVPVIVHLEDDRGASVREAGSMAPMTGGAADAAQPAD